MVITNFALILISPYLSTQSIICRDMVQSELSTKFVITIHEIKILKTMAKQIEFIISDF